MDNTREKLIELIQDGTHQCSKILCKECEHFAKLEKCKANIIADHLIANGVTVQKWIPVTERLPEDRTQVLCFGGVKGYERAKIKWFAVCLETVDQYDFEGQKHSGFYCYDSEYGYYEDTEITHWMPLPQPPKGD